MPEGHVANGTTQPSGLAPTEGNLVEYVHSEPPIVSPHLGRLPAEARSVTERRARRKSSRESPAETADVSVAVVALDRTLVDRLAEALAANHVKIAHVCEPAAMLRALEEVSADVVVVDTRSLGGLPPEPANRLRFWLPSRTDGDIIVVARGTGDAGRGLMRLQSFGGDAIEQIATVVRSLLPLGLPGDPADAMLGNAAQMQNVREQVRSVARFQDVPVLILGETGTGKELVARAIHLLSRGERAPYMPINCAAITENLFESELFGHEAGSYTGAKGTRLGLLEAAAGGTVFLDEVAEMPLTLQPKLLRTLEMRSFRRVGTNHDIPLHARVVSATNRCLDGAKTAYLRSDLLYRLAGFTIVLPPLRERAGDIDLLATTFLESFARRHGTQPAVLVRDAQAVLESHRWPGNVRELRSVVEQAAILAGGPMVMGDHITAALRHRPKDRQTAATPSSRPPVSERTPAGPPSSSRNMVLRDVERELVLKAFNRNRGNVSRTARQLGIARSTLRDRLRRYGV